MKISIGVDHGAVALRTALLNHLRAAGHELVDHGTASPASVDYPDFAAKVCADILGGRADAGILCCTTGIGMSMSANRHPGIRAALVHYEDEAALTRRHNNANVLCLGAMHVTPDKATRLADIFFNESFEGGRHARRVDKIDSLANPGCPS
jgi:ribose 5-phosphate isomerase B